MSTVARVLKPAKDKKLKQYSAILSRWQLYLFLLLPLAYIIIFAYVPMAGLQLAFKKFSAPLGIWGSPWIGFGQFAKFFKSYMFDRVLVNTIKISLYSLIVGFPIPIIFALLLNSMCNYRYKRTIQMITYIPHFISMVVLVGMLLQMINPRIGIFGVLYSTITGMDTPNIIGKPEAFSHLYVWSGIWQNLGWSSIIYIAALSAVEIELHEAAQIDGASRFQRVCFIDFPSILPTAIIMLILNSGQVMNIGFEKVFLMQNNLNLSASEVISTYVYKVGLASTTQDFSYATAIGLFNAIINFALINIVNALSKRISGDRLW